VKECRFIEQDDLASGLICDAHITYSTPSKEFKEVEASCFSFFLSSYFHFRLAFVVFCNAPVGRDFAPSCHLVHVNLGSLVPVYGEHVQFGEWEAKTKQSHNKTIQATANLDVPHGRLGFTID